jgi:hypothetical protein
LFCGLFILRNTHTDQAARKREREREREKNLAAEHRAVRQDEKKRKKNTMIHALIKTTRTTAFALRRRHTHTHTTAEKK